VSATDSSSNSALHQLSPSLWQVDDISNVYLIRRGDRAILIDSGSGLVVDELERLGIKQVDWVLHTHFHRDQCDGTLRLIDGGAKVAAPRGEVGYFAGADNFWRNRTIYDNYNTYNDFFAPIANIPVDRSLADGESFSWQGIELQVNPAPGHTKGGIALVGEIDGRRIAFTGDVIHHAAKPWTLFDLEWAYGQQTGLGSLSLTLQTLAGLGLAAILPAHGQPIDNPSLACSTLHALLSAYHQWLNLHRYPAVGGYPLLPWDTRVMPLTPHLWANTTSVANSYTLLTDDGTAMLLDYGFPSSSHFAGNFRFAEHSLDELRKVAGLKRIDVVLPSHYHDDHVGGLQHIYEKYGARLWVFENMADILEHPHAYKIPCLWEKPMAASRIFGEGESFDWRGTTFLATKTPGHTEYHCALSFELDGRRIAYVGDTLARASAGPRFGGPVFQNRFSPGDFVESVTKIRDFAPEFILTGHFGAQRVEPTFFDAALAQARAIEGIAWSLIAVPEEAGFALDPNWATIYPYQATATPGEPFDLAVRIVNHLSTPTAATVQLRLPEDWASTPLTNAVEIGRSGSGEATFRVTVPVGASNQRHVIAATVKLGNRNFGPIAEGIVRVHSKSDQQAGEIEPREPT
jgi:glyoxylase-like metal-dependent hydrolase (beta-lactamase superfamily II)